MRYLNDFNNYKHINEDKHARAERKAHKAEELLNDIDDAIKAGNEKKAERLMRIAAKRVDRAKELDPSLDVEEISNKLIDVKSKYDAEQANPSDKFDINSIDRRDKIKLNKFDIINKIKIIGDEISNDELQAFLKTVNDYFNQYWENLKTGDNIPKKYQSPHTDFVLEVKRKFGRTVFLYKEGGNDKIKIVFANKDFSKDENKEEIILEINDVLDSENIKQEVESNYEPAKDETKFEPTKPEQLVTPAIATEVITKTEKIADVLTTKDESFINQTVKFLIDEKLNIAYSDTDEDKIFDYFVKKNPTKIVVPENVTDILVRYKKKKATMNEAWYNNADDFVDATVGATDRATQSMRTQESKGVVADLMWAFNTDGRTLTEDINKALSKLTSAYQAELNKAIDNLGNVKLVKEDLDTTSLLTGLLASGYLLRKSPMLARLVGVRGGAALASGGGAAASGGGAAAGGTVARGGLAGISRLGGLLANPYVWIGIAVVAAVAGGWYLWEVIDEQQNQLATIFLIMWASGSPEFHKELKQNGVNIKAPTIDMSKLNNLIKSGEIFSETTSEEPKKEITSEESNAFESKRIKSFTNFKK